MRFVAIYNEEMEKWLRDSRQGWGWRDEPTLFSDEAAAQKVWKAVLSQMARYNDRAQWYQNRYETFQRGMKIIHVTLGVEL